MIRFPEPPKLGPQELAKIRLLRLLKLVRLLRLLRLLKAGV